MASHVTTPQPPPARKAYQPPKLTVFGPLSRLTQNGTGGSKENNGKGNCGLGFQKSGPGSC